MTSLGVLFGKKWCSCLAAEWALPYGLPALASSAGSPCKRKSPAAWVATPLPRGLWSDGELEDDDLPWHHCAGRWTHSLILSDTQCTRWQEAAGGSPTARATG